MPTYEIHQSSPTSLIQISSAAGNVTRRVSLDRNNSKWGSLTNILEDEEQAADIISNSADDNEKGEQLDTSIRLTDNTFATNNSVENTKEDVVDDNANNNQRTTRRPARRQNRHLTQSNKSLGQSLKLEALFNTSNLSVLSSSCPSSLLDSSINMMVSVYITLMKNLQLTISAHYLLHIICSTPLAAFLLLSL